MTHDRIARSFLVAVIISGVSLSVVRANIYSVTTTAESGAGSLRQAIVDANTHAGADTILFTIPASDPGFDVVSGVWTIRPTSDFSSLSDGGTFIDGTTQTASQGDRNVFGPEIEIDGTNAAGANGFTITSPDNVIKGLIINRVNSIAVDIRGTTARGNSIVGNYIGTDPTGMVAHGNVLGGIWIRTGASNNRVGGATEAERNIISGTTTSVNLATGNGVYIDRADSNRILGNYIGVNRNSTAALPNKNTGVCIRECGSNSIGSPAPGEGNVISANGWVGIVLRIPPGRKNTISGNSIGTDPTGQMNLGNVSYGIRFDFGAQENTIGPGNTITFNGSHGISMTHDSTFSNSITRNTIKRNGGSGISIIDGANAGITPPVIGGATASMVTGTAPARSRVEIFSDSSDEGAIYEGTTTADPSGNFTWTGTASGPFVTATCTDSAGNTSAFSVPLIVTGVRDRLDENLPGAYTLSQNFPNPFNPVTTITYELPQTSRVRLTVYDMLGREVLELLDTMREAGVHQVQLDGAPLASGVYMYRMHAGDFSQTRTLVLLK